MPTKKEQPILVDEGAKIGEPVPLGIVDTNTASIGIPLQSELDASMEISALRKELNTLRQQIAEAAGAVKGGARQAARQTEAAVKLYPVSTLAAVAAIVGVCAFAFAGQKAAPSRSRYDRTLDDLRDLYTRLRDRF